MRKDAAQSFHFTLINNLPLAGIASEQITPNSIRYSFVISALCRGDEGKAEAKVEAGKKRERGATNICSYLEQRQRKWVRAALYLGVRVSCYEQVYR